MWCVKVFELVKFPMKQAAEFQELPWCAADATLAVAAVSTSWFFGIPSCKLAS